jgi:hypothetical protein
MDYPRYLENGWRIGSGHVEAACTTVIGQGMKGSGMRWSAAGADAVCQLSAFLKNAPDHWEAFWHRRTAA